MATRPLSAQSELVDAIESHGNHISTGASSASLDKLTNATKLEFGMPLGGSPAIQVWSGPDDDDDFDDDFDDDLDRAWPDD